MNVNNVIANFLDFLNISYENILRLSQKIEVVDKNIILADQIENGFLQFMWEMIVESQLCRERDSIEPYGDGADFYGKSSRAIYPDRFANLKIVVDVVDKKDFLSGQILTESSYNIIKFVYFDGVNYQVKAPLNFVLCDDDSNRNFLFSVEEVDFSLQKIEDHVI